MVYLRLMLSSIQGIDLVGDVPWVNMGKSEGWKSFLVFSNPQYAIVISVLLSSLVNHLIHCSILVNVRE